MKKWHCIVDPNRCQISAGLAYRWGIWEQRPFMRPSDIDGVPALAEGAEKTAGRAAAAMGKAMEALESTK